MLPRFAENGIEQVGSPIQHLRVFDKIDVALHNAGHTNDADDSREIAVQHSPPVAQDIQCTELSCALPVFHAEISTNLARI
ncbi:hypothetical protein WT24_11700 [Burkholderia sp. MSMB1078WGS]|nr:hypothetical protein WT24_11700 [Burkholderia sp. MSMB1078WGS]